MFSKMKQKAQALALIATVAMFSVPAHAGVIDDLFAAIDLATVAVAVGAVGLLVVGIAMSFKGIDLSKRAVRKV